MAIARVVSVVGLLLLNAGCGSVVDRDGELPPLCAFMLNCEAPTPPPVKHGTPTLIHQCGIGSVVRGPAPVLR